MATVETLGRLVPGPAAARVDCLPANNNLDLVRFDGRVWLAWRTAPTHFASRHARLEVSSAPGIDGPWRHEGTVALGADGREPRWTVDGSRLHLWFMELGTDPRRFQPRGVHRATVEAGGDGDGLGPPRRVLDADTVPWRIRRLRGRWALIGYRGAEKMYSARPADPTVEVWWSDDLESWDPPVDLHPGGTECELVELPDGRLLGLTRNEGPSRRGSDLLVGPELDDLAVTPIARKLDSPHLFLWDGVPHVLARRQLAFGGRYDLVPRRTPGSLAIRVDQLVWWLTRKRSTLYRIDVDRPAVIPVIDLPSRGDTAFAAVLPEPDGTVLVADYTSPASGGDVMWMRGQRRPTEIWLHRLHP